MRFSELALTSAQVAETSSRLGKIGRLADLLTRLDEREIEPTVAFLSGTTRQGRIGVGYAAIRSASDTAPAEEPTLEILEVDDAFAALVQVSGKGSAAERARILRSLFGAEHARRAGLPWTAALRRAAPGRARGRAARRDRARREGRCRPRPARGDDGRRSRTGGAGRARPRATTAQRSTRSSCS